MAKPAPAHRLLHPALLLAALLLPESPTIFNAQSSPATPPNPDHRGWVELFNGTSLEGWRHVGPGDFRVDKGSLVSFGGTGLLVWTGGPVGHCELRIVYRMRGATDRSGVLVRSPVEPRDPLQALSLGFRIPIDNKADDWHRTGTLSSFTAALASPARSGPLWNTLDITLDGPHTVVNVNDETVTDFLQRPDFKPPPRRGSADPALGPRPDEGWIALENFGYFDSVEFREIALRKLGPNGL